MGGAVILKDDGNRLSVDIGPGYFFLATTFQLWEPACR